MMFSESVKMTIANFRTSKVRTFLTMLGMIIGVAAVVLITGIGNRQNAKIMQTLSGFSDDNISVMINGIGSRDISVDEMYKIVKNDQEHFSRLSPDCSVEGEVKIGPKKSTGTALSGVSEEYLLLSKRKLSAGRWFSYVELLRRRKVCVIGSYLNEEYFAGDAVGKTLRIGGSLYTIVGVLEKKQSSEKGSYEDDRVFIPYTVAARNGSKVTSYSVSVPDTGRMKESMDAMRDELMKVFHNENAFYMDSWVEMLKELEEEGESQTIFLAVIAGISLFVGGVGIMNIMLVSVTERTREIGVRKALGARQGYIMSQFVVESAITSALGGILGILFGYVGCHLVNAYYQMSEPGTPPVSTTFSSVLLATGVSVLIGIIFGYLPARKAAHMNPIDALRYD